MDRDDKCKSMQEQFPMLFNRILGEEEAAALRRHLEVCPNCRAVFEKEHSLLDTASKLAEKGGLEDHPDAELLDALVRAPSKLSPSQAEFIQAHSEHCPVCRGVMNEIRQLPQTLDELVSDDEVPLVAGLDTSVAGPPERSRIIDIFRSIFWRPAAAVAAAAVLLLFALDSLFDYKQAPLSQVEARFGVTYRGEDSVEVFTAESTTFLFHAEIYVDPETDHTYNIQLYSPRGDSLVYRQDAVTDFDRRGNARFSLPLQTGRYELIVTDIAGDDTLIMRRPFEIRLRP